MESPAEALLASLRIIPDPRVNRTLRHPLESILFVAICGVLCGAESWIDLEAFGVSRKEWLSGCIPRLSVNSVGIGASHSIGDSGRGLAVAASFPLPGETTAFQTF